MNRYFYHNGFIPIYQKNDELLDLMERSIDAFNLMDKFLMKNEYYEVSMVHCLAQHMNELIRYDYRFRDMYVDIEYNKGADGNTYAGKYLYNMEGEKDKNIRLDLVVTSREYSTLGGYHNLLCAEFKKESNKDGWEDDRWRLQQLTKLDFNNDEGKDKPLYGYFIGFFVLINEEKMWIENAYDSFGELPKDIYTGRIMIPDRRYERYEFR